MKNDNCITCMYSNHRESSIRLNDALGTKYLVCCHDNSPFYNELVDEEKSCRLYLDSVKYFLRKDRKEKLENLKKSNES